jgi:transaldolase
MNQLEQLRQFSIVAADTGDFRQLGTLRPRDVTTNPSLILQAVRQPEYQPLLREVVAAHDKKPLDKIIDEVLVRIGCESLRVVQGRVSTEVDARLSFDAGATIARAQRIVELYERAGFSRKRVLVKIAATWEGIQAAKALEHQGIACSMTLVFSLGQAVACGEAGVSMIVPFVGRIGEWHRQAPAPDDPGVQLVSRIYTYFKKFGISTAVMGASLRSTGQVLALAGCDLLTIKPELLTELQSRDDVVRRRLDPDAAKAAPIHALTLNEASFRYAMNDDPMATELLAAGIRQFAADTIRLEGLIESLP